jgi:probable phosphomutase (TIGR03848 family)
MTRFLLIRHATCGLKSEMIAGWMSGVHLDKAGKEQAEALAVRLAPARLSALYSSPLERAQETAEPIARLANLDVTLRERLGEVRCGDWTGAKFSELDHFKEWKQFEAFRSSVRIPNGETMIEVQARVAAEILEIHQQHEGSTVAIVSHGDVIRCALAHFAGIPLDLSLRLQIDAASISVIELSELGPRIVKLNGTSKIY